MSGAIASGDLEAHMLLLEAGVAAAANAGAQAHRADAQARMFEPKSGRRYGGHQAAAPGEAPGFVTTALWASIEVDQEGNDARVYSEDPVATFQEFGTVRMPPHPFFYAAQAAGEEAAAAMLEAYLSG